MYVIIDKADKTCQWEVKLLAAFLRCFLQNAWCHQGCWKHCVPLAGLPAVALHLVGEHGHTHPGGDPVGV